MKKYKQILIVVILLVSCIKLSVPAAPLLCKMFLKYPTLEEVAVYKGTVWIKGEEVCKRAKQCTPPTYYVVNDTGKHEIYYGLPGDRYARYSKKHFQNTPGTFWFDPVFGVIQEEYLFTKNEYTPKELLGEVGNTVFRSYDERKNLYDNHFDYSKYTLMAWPFFMAGFFLLYSLKSLFFKSKTVRRTN